MAASPRQTDLNARLRAAATATASPSKADGLVHRPALRKTEPDTRTDTRTNTRVGILVKVPKTTRDALRHLAINREMTLQQLCAEALQSVLDSDD